MSDDELYGRPRQHQTRLTKDLSFLNLVALANDKENYELSKLTKHGKKLVWRDAGEAPVMLERFEDCLEHAYTGGLRAAIIGYTARSGVNLFILFFNLSRTAKKVRTSLVLRAIFNLDSLRFGSMLGAFVTIYKYILNVLPILFRESTLRKHAQESSGSPAEARPVGLVPPNPNGGVLGLDPSGAGAKPQKSALKQPSPLRAEDVRLPSVDSSRAASPTGLEGPRRARFAEDGELIQTAPTPPPVEYDPEAYKAHLSSSVKQAFKVMAKNGYVYERWHATVAGAVAGAIAILFEKKSRRLSISQQMFVRGLQGSFNFWSNRFGIKIPFGSVWLFALCCGQIMYGFLLRPDTIPRSYEVWIQKASVVPDAAVEINRQLVYDGTLNISLQKKLAHGFTKPWFGNRPVITEENKADMLQQAAKAISGASLPPMATCSSIHPHRNGCVPTGLWRIWESGKWMAPMYGALHFVPILLFKRKKFMDDPFITMVKALWGTIRSSTFLGVYVAIYQSYICFLHFLYRLRLDPSMAPAFRRFILSKPMWWFGGILAGMSLFIEDSRRRPELAMYVLPKGLESGWKLLRGELFGIPTQRKKRGWKSDVALSAAGMAMVMSTYQHSPDHLSSLVRRLLYQFVGTN